MLTSEIIIEEKQIYNEVLSTVVLSTGTAVHYTTVPVLSKMYYSTMYLRFLSKKYEKYQVLY